MDYVQITDGDREAMLEKIGAESVEALYGSLDQKYRVNGLLDLPEARSELELQRELSRMAEANRTASQQACFLGGGAYDHFIPSVVNSLSSRGEYVTAYTPYQAEASQGSLQAFFEFQTQVCRLTGMDVANASLYEGATSVGEAVTMAVNVTGKRRVLYAQTLHPHFKQVIKTYFGDLPVDLVELPATDGRIDPATISEHGDNDTAAVIVQSPNVLGLIEPWQEQFEKTHEMQKTLAVAVFNPIACALLKRPGECGADIAAGEGQPLGVPLQFGGPYLGLFAATSKLMRKMPGRLIGQSTDKSGERGFCLTLQTREQHIRGAKATSNICTNQGLLAMRATMYISAMGPQGLKDVATQCYQKAHYLAEQIASIDGFDLAYEGPFFHEFVVKCPTDARKIIDSAKAQGILAGLDCSELSIGEKNELLIAVTEKRTKEQLDAYVSFLKEVA